MEKNKDKFKTRYFEIHESHKLSSHGNYLRRTNFIFIKAKRNLESRRFVRSNGSLKLRSKKFHAEKFSRRTRHDHVQSYKKKKKKNNKKEKGKKRKEKKRR